MKSNYTTCDTDDTFIELYTNLEPEFFKANGIDSKIALLPDYVTSNNYIYANYYRPFILWKIQIID